MVGSILCTTTIAPAAFSLNFLSILKVWSLGHQSLLIALPAKIAQDQFPFEILIVASPKWAGKYYRVSNSCMHFSSPSASLELCYNCCCMEDICHLSPEAHCLSRKNWTIMLIHCSSMKNWRK
jgi:hypothetical protein